MKYSYNVSNFLTRGFFVFYHSGSVYDFTATKGAYYLITYLFCFTYREGSKMHKVARKSCTKVQNLF